MQKHQATAKAHANIALAKYWGKTKTSQARNLPAVPSVSVTLEALSTVTTVHFDPALHHDEVRIQGEVQEGRAKQRVCELLERVRNASGLALPARVTSSNDFPTASGLASSASAFAALALASTAAAGLDWDTAKVSDLARQSSASAGRSLFGGFVRLPAGKPQNTFLPSEPIAPPEHWDIRVIVAVISEKPKTMSSTVGMNHTAETSPYFEAWTSLCPGLASTIEEAIRTKSLTRLGLAAEQSALAMHASALAAAPGIIYFEPASIAVLHAIRKMREDGLEAYATMDAGPHVKVITAGQDAQKVAKSLESVPGVLRTIVSKLGGPARLCPTTSEA